jgi:hypothetical protein
LLKELNNNAITLYTMIKEVSEQKKPKRLKISQEKDNQEKTAFQI